MMAFSKEIQTLLFFDLESTSVPSFDFTGQRTRITELSFVAISENHLKEPKFQSGELPRVIHKLTLCCNPRRLILPKAQEVSGLSNYTLEHEVPFNEDVAECILTFMKHLRQPICLLAHNGKNFDFPLLKSEFASVGKELPNDILCADTWEAAVALFDVQNPQCSSVPFGRIAGDDNCVSSTSEYIAPATTSSCSQSQPDSNHNENDVIPSTPERKTKQSYSFSPKAPKFQASLLESLTAKQCMTVGSTQNQDEDTNMLLSQHEMLFKDPEVLSQVDEIEQSASKCRVGSFGGTTLDIDEGLKKQLNSIHGLESPSLGEVIPRPHSLDHVKKQLNFSRTDEQDPNDANVFPDSQEDLLLTPKKKLHAKDIPSPKTPVRSFCGLSSPDTPSKQKRGSSATVSPEVPSVKRYARGFGLGDLYERTFGCRDFAAHTAEGDTLALLKVMQTKAGDFVNWVQENAVAMSEIRAWE